MDVTLQVSLPWTVDADDGLRIIGSCLDGAGQAQGPAGLPAQVSIAGCSPDGIAYEVRFAAGSSAEAEALKMALVRALRERMREPAAPAGNGSARLAERLAELSHKDQMLSLLRRTELFRSLDVSEAETLARSMRLLLLHQGDGIVKQGEPGDSMFLVDSGLLEVRASTADASASTPLGSVHADEFFGEMSLLTGEPRSATVTAATDCIVLEITSGHLRELLRKRPQIARTLSAVAAQRQLRGHASHAPAGSVAGPNEQSAMARQILTGVKTFFQLDMSIDSAAVEHEVAAITQSDSFQSIRQRAALLRRTPRPPPPASQPRPV